MKKILFIVIMVFSCSLFSCTADQENGDNVGEISPQGTEILGSAGNFPVKPPAQP